MSQPGGKPRGAQTSSNNHPLPRRASPANSITLRHHRLARDASLRVSPGSSGLNASHETLPPRRNSSGESHDTRQSDPKTWFDQSNQNPTATFDNNTMDVDPPFFQRESDSSNEGKPYQLSQYLTTPKLKPVDSSSADDYRSVIDDLTVEIQSLREELKRYKQLGPDMLRKEKLFEIKVHGLPKRKKRELEATLRDFAASLEGSPDASSSQLKKKSRHTVRDRIYSGSGSISKNASSSSGSNARPADSAYASMSAGGGSSGTLLSRPSMQSQARSSEQKVENYLRDIPEGLHPSHKIMTDRDKKKLVVRRLEQLFTGKISGRQAHRNKENFSAPPNAALAPIVAEPNAQGDSAMHMPPALLTGSKETSNESTNAGTDEWAREARILPLEQQYSAQPGKKNRPGDNGDQPECGGNGDASGSGNPSPPMPQPPDQRPTRPKDLDPDRVQIPSENMDYIRHLGLVPPELLAEPSQPTEDVHPDADGWVYLNLLCSLAQLHIINVTPDFVRHAVTGVSTKFQLSPDGRKIRWRGGTQGTRFSSDSSGENSQKSPSTDDTDDTSKEESRKRHKTRHSTGDDFQSGSSGKNASKFGPQISTSSKSFQYKPLFVHQDVSNTQTSQDEASSSYDALEESHLGDSKWGLSGSGVTSARRKRRHDGAIIYYSGAPFCTDLSGDPGDVSPTAYMLSSGQGNQVSWRDLPPPPPPPRRSQSGSSITYKPLNEKGCALGEDIDMDVDSNGQPPCLTSDDSDERSEVDIDLIWSDEQQYMELRHLDPCGLGGVLPDDHFMVVVTTRRPKEDCLLRERILQQADLDGTAEDSIISHLAGMSTSSPVPGHPRALSQGDFPRIEIEYLSGRIKRLAPVPLPPPALFFPPFSSDESEESEESGSSEDEESSSAFMSRRVNPHQSDDYPDGVDLSSGDEDGEDPDESPDGHGMYDVDQNDYEQILLSHRRQPSRRTSSAAAAAGTARDRSKSASADLIRGDDGSSAATAGGMESGYSSGGEDSS